MPKRPIESYRKVPSYQHKSLHIAPYNHHQHGSPSLLLGLPQESLTHVTSYLPPPSLLALARTCRYLCGHIDDDNTWLRALLNQHLGINPEHELENESILLLKRTENTWRREFILRHDIRQCVVFIPARSHDLVRFQALGALPEPDRHPLASGFVHRRGSSHVRARALDDIHPIWDRRAVDPAQRKGAERVHRRLRNRLGYWEPQCRIYAQRLCMCNVF